jgi:hypothetical protein
MIIWLSYRKRRGSLADLLGWMLPCPTKINAKPHESNFAEPSRNQGSIHIFHLIQSVDPNTININTPNHVLFFDLK